MPVLSFVYCIINSHIIYIHFNFSNHVNPLIGVNHLIVFFETNRKPFSYPFHFRFPFAHPRSSSPSRHLGPDVVASRLIRPLPGANKMQASLLRKRERDGTAGIRTADPWSGNLLR